MGMIFSTNETISIDNSNYNAIITRSSPEWGVGYQHVSSFLWDTIQIDNYNIGEIAKSLTEYSDTSYWLIDNEVIDFKKYNMLVVQKDSSAKIDYRNVLIEFSESMKIKIDTIKESRQVWVLNAKNWDNITYKQSENYDYHKQSRKDIYSLCSELSIPSILSTEEVFTVIPQKGINNITIIIDNNLYSQQSFAEKKNILELHYGITLTKRDTIINVIRIRNR